MFRPSIKETIQDFEKKKQEELEHGRRIIFPTPEERKQEAKKEAAFFDACSKAGAMKISDSEREQLKNKMTSGQLSFSELLQIEMIHENKLQRTIMDGVETPDRFKHLTSTTNGDIRGFSTLVNFFHKTKQGAQQPCEKNLGRNQKSEIGKTTKYSDSTPDINKAIPDDKQQQHEKNQQLLAKIPLARLAVLFSRIAKEKQEKEKEDSTIRLSNASEKKP